MKKIGLILVVCLALAALTACTDSSKNEETTQAEETAATDNNSENDTSADAAAFTYKGTAIAMKADAAAILEALGEAKHYTETTSCAFDGLDKEYTYTSFVITTYPTGDEDFINSVTLVDDTVSTPEGICIGDAQDKVEEVLGADLFNGVNAYIRTEGDTMLTVIITDGVVSSIQYTAVFE